MHVVPRKIGVALAGAAAAAALAVPMAGEANAATSTVRIHNAATGGPGLVRLTDDGTSVPVMKAQLGAVTRWIKTEVSQGYATYRSVLGATCLTGRGLVGFNGVTLEQCTAGNLRQQWRLSVFGDLQLRANGLVAEVDTANPNLPLRMGFFTVKPNQKWTVLPAFPAL